jgi:ketosteroid isomerase-like protein
MGLAVLSGIVAGTAAASTPLAAQTLPGIGDAKGVEINSEYLAFLRDSSREFIARWQDAWFNDQVGELTELYAHNAVLTTPDGGARRGDARISAYLSRLLPLVGGITTSSVILDGSGDLAFVYGRYQLEGAEGLSGATGDQGDHLTVLFQHRRQWTIRNQAFASKAQSSGIPWAPGEVEETLPPLDLSEFTSEGVDNLDWLIRLYPSAASLTVSFNDVWSSGNVGGLMSFSTDDVFMRTIEGEFLVGKEAVREALGSPASGFANTIYLGPVDFTASTMVSILHARYYLQAAGGDGALSQGTVFLLLEGSGNDLALRGVVFAPTTPGA